LLLAILFSFGLTMQVLAQSASPPLLPPVVDPPTQEHHAGKVIFTELATPDLAAAERFYGGLFGWTFHDIQLGPVRYAQASLNGDPIAGLFQKSLPAGNDRRPAWLNFISVEDVDVTAKLAVQNGGTVLREAHDILGRGRQAVLADPQGAVFAILASSAGDPPDDLADPGEWIWNSLITRDPDTDAAFYQKLFGYEVFDLSSSDNADHLLLATDNIERASVNPFPVSGRGAYPHWLSFVRVEDADKVADKVQTLGGRVLVAPRPDRHGGKIALVADPAGAVFGLLEWPATGKGAAP
jgi:predicted enzyme related to lactoylglutathione lyase